MAALTSVLGIGLGIVMFMAAFTILVRFFPLRAHAHQIHIGVAALAIAHAFGVKTMGLMALGAVIVAGKEGMGGIHRLSLGGRDILGGMAFLAPARGFVGLFMRLMAVFAGLSPQDRRVGVKQILRGMAIRAIAR